MTQTVLVSLLAVAGFGLGLWWLNIGAVARGVITAATDGVSSMLDRELDDDAKEQALQRTGLLLLRRAWQTGWRFAAALALAGLPIVLADLSGLVASDRVMALMMRLDYIVVVSVLAIVIVSLLRRARSAMRAPVTDTHTQYSGVDRFFHILAFASPAVLKRAARWEDRFNAQAAAQDALPPVFVTSLARGGTTAVLNALSDAPGLATHTYRDMPFLTAPRLWQRLSGGDRRQVARKERAHGDGLEIDLDSPEAFEEAIWQILWPEKYQGSAIPLWQAADSRPDADAFLYDHMRKIIAARSVNAGRARARYCSKNNGNIARLRYLPGAFPGCRIVVPVRRPESHVASLLRQHQNFSKLQGEDDFVRRYMRDIGHYEFGLIHKPVLFDGFAPDRYDPATPDYWLSYWIQAFREVAAHRADCILVTQDDLRARPQQTMDALCDTLGVETRGIDFKNYFRTEADEAPRDVFTPALFDEAHEIFRVLQASALKGG